jgi:exopolysaccharide biosynthesis operon protein EpsL
MNNNISTRLRIRWLLLGLLVPMVAHADEDDALNLVTSVNWQYLDNVFYLPDGAKPTAFGPKAPRADSSWIANVGLNFDKMVGRQKLTASATQSVVRYNKLGDLDYDGHNLAAGWQWVLGNDLTGKLSYTNRRYLAGFGDFRSTQLVQNLIDVNAARFDAAYKIDTYWTLFGSAGHETQRNSTKVREPNDLDLDRLEAGVRYTTRGGTTFELLGRNVDGNLPKRLPGLGASNSYTQQDVEARISWQPVGHSRLSAAIGQSSRDHDDRPDRDYDDVYGRLSWEWQPTGHTGVTFKAERQISPLDDFITSYFRTTTYSIAPVWQPTSKLRFDGLAKWVSRDAQGSTILSGLSPATLALFGISATPRQEDLATYSLGATWSILRNLSANAEARYDERDSNVQFYQYRVRSVSMSLQYVF